MHCETCEADSYGQVHDQQARTPPPHEQQEQQTETPHASGWAPARRTRTAFEKGHALRLSLTADKLNNINLEILT